MFDLFAPSHLLLIALAILLFVGPKDLPKFMHMVGTWTRKGRRLADEFRDGLNKMEQQGDLDELRKEIAALRNAGPLDTRGGAPLQTAPSMRPEPGAADLDDIADDEHTTVLAA
jgi:Tat protein translocase TatB subunit